MCDSPIPSRISSITLIGYLPRRVQAEAMFILLTPNQIGGDACIQCRSPILLDRYSHDVSCRVSVDAWVGSRLSDHIMSDPAREPAVTVHSPDGYPYGTLPASYA